MKKALFVGALIAIFVFAFATAAFAATPSVIAGDGGSVFTYQDLRDLSGAKLSGGYATFDTTASVRSFNSTPTITNATTMTVSTNDVYASNSGAGPHGGYGTATNKCKVCHAVHRAEGAYYLLRADSQADACDYCHIGGSAHSAKVVYDLNPAGTDTTNGHTMGAGMVPDSSVKQDAAPVTISGTDKDGISISEVVNVRSYDPTLIQLYRFSRHHSQSAVSTGRSGFKPVGPNSLSCFSCHQPHGAPAQSWQPEVYSAAFADPSTMGNATYKLLRRFPSGSWKPVQDASHGTAVGQAAGVNTYGMIDTNLAVKVPETTLTADGVNANYSRTTSNETTYTENGFTGSQPTWIAQNISGEASGTGPAEDPATVNQYTLSVWCADCHNLNIGGSEALTQEELGFKAHTERTHPAPFTGAHSGPGQCYSCHRNDLSVSQGKGDPVGYGMNQAASTGSDACSQCHYGTQAYAADQAATSGRESDFPHSGKATDIKLLGSYTANVAGPGSYTPVFTQATITEDNLDAVCIRCHPGIGVHN